MKKLIKNAKVLNGFLRKIQDSNILIEDDIIAGVGDYYTDEDADVVIDVEGRYVTPSFADGHIHIESTMLTPRGFAKLCVPHGTGMVMADPHEIANVCGTKGVEFMRKASKLLPMDFYYVMPSCVPACMFDESGATLTAKDIEPFYKYPDILGLGEMMNFPGVLANDPEVMAKIKDAQKYGKVVEGHAPLLHGKDLDQYVRAGIQDDHECTTMEEAIEKISKGQHVMIRQGSAARNLDALVDLIDSDYVLSCMFVTDDKEAKDIMQDGHMDAIVREVIRRGKNPIDTYLMATAMAPKVYRLNRLGFIGPGYYANLLVIDDFEKVDIRDVYYHGECVYKDKKFVKDFDAHVDLEVSANVRGAFNVKTLEPKDFHVEPKGSKCRVIQTVPGEITTKQVTRELDFEKENGVDVKHNIVKLAVVERHKGTGHIGLGYVEGLGIEEGAIAQTIAHDSHNLIIAGTSEEDMALAGNTVAKEGGGICVVKNGKVLNVMPLPIAGLMSDKEPEDVVKGLDEIHRVAGELGAKVPEDIIVKLSFIALPVIPSLKMTTKGLVDVEQFKIVDLFV